MEHNVLVANRSQLEFLVLRRDDSTFRLSLLAIECAIHKHGEVCVISNHWSRNLREVKTVPSDLEMGCVFFEKSID